MIFFGLEGKQTDYTSDKRNNAYCEYGKIYDDLRIFFGCIFRYFLYLFFLRLLFNRLVGSIILSCLIRSKRSACALLKRRSVRIH